MRYRLAIVSAGIFSIIWPRIHNPSTVLSRCTTNAVVATASHSAGLSSSQGGVVNLGPSSLRRRRSSSYKSHRLFPPLPTFCRNNNNMSSTTTSSISYSLLQKQNSETSNAIIEHYASAANTNKPSSDFNDDNNVDLFTTLAEYEGNLTAVRDAQDDEKLQQGIDYAKTKGVIPSNYIPEPYVTIDVLGKTPNQVAQTILTTIQQQQAQDSNSNNDNDDSGKEEEQQQGGGYVVVLVGLSGTGKGTTVAALRQELEKSQQQDGGERKQDDVVVTWSNGNIFRSVTLLAVTWCEQQQNDGACHRQDNDNNGGVLLDLDKALTKGNIANFMSMLAFGKFNGKYDTRIHGLGLDMLVSEVQNTKLKSPKVSKHIPAVAERTQGEVIMFAAHAVDVMGKDGLVVLLEGREQTVNYVKTPHRFCLVLSDETLIGKRRAAQRLMADALKHLPPTSGNEDDDDGNGVSNEQVMNALDQSLSKMVAEIN